MDPYLELPNGLSEGICSLAMGNSESTQLTILHFNDVYNIEPRDQEPVGGAARFHTAVKERLALNPLILFSGDVFNPSLMSAVTKGKQMVPILNAIGVHCAVVGNHDFDFGVDTLVQMSSQTSFPWLMGNVFDNETDAPLADCLMSHIIVWQGKKMGLIGLVEEEWIDTLSTIDPDDITYVDYVQQGKMLCKQLKEDGVDYIIALTHMRWPNDIRLAQEVEDIDLILGGHDHDYVIDKINGKYIIKSGTDFRQMSQITLTFENKKVDVKVEEVTIDSSVKQDEDIAKVVNDYLDIMGEEMEQVLGHMEVEMDGRFASLRNKETNLGNFITNIMLECTDAEVAILNSGTLRSDTIHPRGPFKVKDLLSILPLIDPLVVIKVKGQQILDALENGVSQYPKLEGRFPQVAGIMFGFDPNLPTGQRLIRDKVKVQGESVELEREYRVCTKHYLAEGKDGYDMFKDCAMLVNDEEGPRLSVVVQNHFNSVKLLKGEEKSKFQHRQSLIAVNRRKSLARQASIQLEHIPHLNASPSNGDLHMSASNRSLLRGSTIAGPERARLNMRRRNSIMTEEQGVVKDALAPEVEGRIYIVNSNNNQKPTLTEASPLLDRLPTLDECESPLEKTPSILS